MAEDRALAGAEPDDGAIPGARLVNAVIVGTGVLVGTSVAAAVSPDQFQTLHAAYSCLLFAIGTAAMLWAYALGVSRSRTDAVDVLGLFLLAGDVAPVDVRRPLRLALAVQVVAVVAAAAIRPFTPVAFGVLAPTFGLGMMGVWAGRYGTFSPASRG